MIDLVLDRIRKLVSHLCLFLNQAVSDMILSKLEYKNSTDTKFSSLISNPRMLKQIFML